jgi:hypothetical protein
MPNYRRALVLGGCWFFTSTLLERRQLEKLRALSPELFCFVSWNDLALWHY